MKPELQAIIGRLNRESYLSIAEDFSKTRKSAWYDFSYLDPYLSEGMRVLDLGCGNGRLFPYLSTRCKVSYMGIDANSHFITEARNRYAAHPFHAQFHVRDITTDPWPKLPEGYDGITSVATLNHFSRNEQARMIKNAYALLKPGGILYSTTWNMWRLDLKGKSIWNFWKERLIRSNEDFRAWYRVSKGDLGLKDVITLWKGSRYHSPLYYYAATARDMGLLCQKVGFEQVDSFYSLQGKKVSWYRGRNIITLARKPL